MARLGICFFIVSLLSCSPPVFEQRIFWQRLGSDIPGRMIDPYSDWCDLVKEELHTTGPIEDRQFWLKRYYLCPTG